MRDLTVSGSGVSPPIEQTYRGRTLEDWGLKVAGGELSTG